MKFLFALMAIPVFLCAQAGILPDVFGEAEMVKVYNNGQEIVMSEEAQEKFDELFIESISGSRQMPAFAVAIHKLTMEDFKQGYWVKFDYGKKMNASGMPFDQLLIHVQKDVSGINVIRGNNGKFDGRCYYLDLEENLDKIYDFLVNIEALPSGEIKFEVEKSEEPEVEIVEEEEDDDDEDLEASNIPSVNKDKDNENKVIQQDVSEKRDAKEALFEAVSQFNEEE